MHCVGISVFTIIVGYRRDAFGVERAAAVCGFLHGGGSYMRMSQRLPAVDFLSEEVDTVTVTDQDGLQALEVRFVGAASWG